MFSGIFLQFLESSENFAHFPKNDLVYSLNIWKVTESEKCVELNARKLLFTNTLRESTCSRVPFTVEIWTAGLLS